MFISPLALDFMERASYNIFCPLPWWYGLGLLPIALDGG